jgi:hypothetical protein
MEHHQNNFDDFSLIVTKNQKWVAILPANVSGNVVHSHQYLTYGGLVFKDDVKQIEVVEILKIILIFLEKNALEKLVLKIIPAIYHKKPSDDLEYALWLAKATLVGRDCLKVLDLQKKITISKTRLEAIRRGKKNSLTIQEEPNFGSFWSKVLTPNMQNRHNVNPIHSLLQIEYLQRTFTQNIRHFNVYLDSEVVAGSTIFVTDNVVHPQHISALENRNALGSIDFLYHHLIANVFKNHKYFDFGSSNNHDGSKIDQNLIFWKESYGTSTVKQDFYEIGTANHKFLNNYLL